MQLCLCDCLYTTITSSQLMPYHHCLIPILPLTFAYHRSIATFLQPPFCYCHYNITVQSSPFNHYCSIIIMPYVPISTYSPIPATHIHTFPYSHIPMLPYSHILHNRHCIVTINITHHCSITAIHLHPTITITSPPPNCYHFIDIPQSSLLNHLLYITSTPSSSSYHIYICNYLFTIPQSPPHHHTNIPTLT